SQRGPVIRTAFLDEHPAMRTRSFARRRVATAALLGVLAISLVLAVPALRPVVREIREMNAVWITAAVALELASCLSFVVIFRLFFERVAAPDARALAWTSMASGVLLPGGGVGGLAIGGWLMRLAGTPTAVIVRRSSGLFFLTSAVNGAAIMGAGLLLVAGAAGPPDFRPAAPARGRRGARLSRDCALGPGARRPVRLRAAASPAGPRGGRRCARPRDRRASALLDVTRRRVRSSTQRLVLERRRVAGRIPGLEIDPGDPPCPARPAHRAARRRPLHRSAGEALARDRSRTRRRRNSRRASSRSRPPTRSPRRSRRSGRPSASARTRRRGRAPRPARLRRVA